MRSIAALLLLVAAASLSADTTCDCACPKPQKTCPPAAPGAALPDLSNVQPARIDGVFVVLDEGVAAHTWPKALGCLASAGIRHVIIQSPSFDWKAAEALVRAAIGRKDVNVYVGLHFQNDFSSLEAPLDEALRNDQTIADRVAQWPKPVVAAIDGWYIAHELHNFKFFIGRGATNDQRMALTRKRADELRKYLGDVTSYVRNIRKGEVLISPHFNATQDGGLLTPAETTEIFRRMFEGTGISWVLLQDGFGARNAACRIGCCRWDRGEFAAPALAYERAVRDALTGTRIGFGVNVESFDIDADDCGTRTVGSGAFDVQRRIARVAKAGRVVTFSLRHLLQLRPELDACIRQP